MRIALDITPLTPQSTGVGEYIRRLIPPLAALLPPESLCGWATGRRRPVNIGISMPYRYFPAPTRAAYACWRLLSYPAIDSLLGGVDIVHATNYFLPPMKKAKSVLTVYDLAFLVEPRWASPRIVGPFSRDVPEFVRRADAVITCSEHSRQDIVRICRIPEEKVHVAYGAPDPAFSPMDRAAAREYVRTHLGWEFPFILYTGTLESRKNLETLIRAFADIAPRYPHKLVLVGGIGWGVENIPALIEELGLGDRILKTGYLPSREHLIAVYGAADIFVLPSHYEGFGLPLVEAMACGCPCIAARTSSLPEVGGDAVDYFDPASPSALAAALDTLLTDEGRRKRLGEAGKTRARRFSWENTAETISSVYRGLLGCV